MVEKKPMWELRKDNIKIGTLLYRTTDWPWIICDFLATPVYEKYQSAFEEWGNTVNNPSPEQRTVDLDEFYEAKIGSLNLSLIPLDDAWTINEFMLHIYDGKEVWFRYW